MLKANSFLAVDFGAGSLKLAEFEVNEAGGLVLKQYVIKSLGLEGSQETKREAADPQGTAGVHRRTRYQGQGHQRLRARLPRLLQVRQAAAGGCRQGDADHPVRGASRTCRSRWRRLFGIIRFLGTTAGGELEVLLVAIKSDIVEGLFRATEAAGLHLQICDVSPAALCNAFRYNYGDLEDCTMLLDIGAKTSNLLFFEKGKVFSRSINLGANSITQDFANEAKLKFDQAEKIKIDEGFVSLGGAYEEPENPASGGDFQDRAAVHDAAAHPGQPDHAVLSRAAGRVGAAAAVPVRRRVHHALHGAVFRGEAQCAGGILQSVPQRAD